MLDHPISTGIVPFAALLLGIGSFGFLLIGRGSGWWRRRVPIALITGIGLTAAFAWSANHVWHPFADPVPGTAVLWIGLSVSALGLAVARRKPWLNRVAAVAMAFVIALCGAVQMNAELGTYPTMRAALDAPEPGQVPSAQALTANAELAPGSTDEPLIQTWVPPAGLPTAGQVTSAPIPGTVSGFTAGDAWIYLPPAYQTTPRAVLPVLILLSGQPGEPRNWVDGGQLAQTMDAYAAAHHGLAPVVVVPDWLGSEDANPMCVDSPEGNDFTYLTVDVRNWILGNLQVDRDPAEWAVGGLSAGATCSVQLAVNAPTLFPTFLAFSTQDQPTLGDHQDTVDELFNGNESAYTAVNPLAILAVRRFPGSAGVFAAGASDDDYNPQTRTVFAAAEAAGMNVQFLELPGGHDFPFWSAALAASMPWLGNRLDITS